MQVRKELRATEGVSSENQSSSATKIEGKKGKTERDSRDEGDKIKGKRLDEDIWWRPKSFCIRSGS
jgi:hypothetical protein